jgi:hypothetical protein
MADRLLFIGWDEVARGREERALECFNDCVGYYGRLQQQGQIETLDVVLLPPTGSGLQGYFELHGTIDQLNTVREDGEFTRLMTEASMCVDGLRIIHGYTNEGVAQQMAVYTEAVGKVPQAT